MTFFAEFVKQAIFYYAVYEKGVLIDGYDSFPGYANEEASVFIPEGGDAHILCRTFRAEKMVAEVDKILRYPCSYYESESERHQDLASALGMPEFLTSMSYDDFDIFFENDSLDNYVKSDFVKIEVPVPVVLEDDIPNPFL